MKGAEDLGDVEAMNMVLQQSVGVQHIGSGIEARFECFEPRRHRDDLVALVDEVSTQRLAKRVLVLDDQHSRQETPLLRLRLGPRRPSFFTDSTPEKNVDPAGKLNGPNDTMPTALTVVVGVTIILLYRNRCGE